ncbi:MAG: ribose-phosphate pyrophosphokinase [Veillonella sp.]|uniref:ribose-phosphate diphosphokinase n=1 Tax=Veillonella sp. TaxID=1926307 RepID=UPI00257A925F|nr:ribose-phosphate pyrophosphokinase [Veillonella sp.]MBS5756739.1 ribose-phosphate pyrophosphokinase [Veillonella sp.]
MAFEDGKKLKIFTGNANPELAKEICDYLGLPLGEAFVGRFNNGEVQIMIDESVRGKDVFIIQPTSYPVNDNLMELMPITAKLVANLMQTSGITRLVTIDLHAGQIQGFFDVPVDHLYGASILAKYINEKNLEDVIVVSPDLGGVTRARDLADRIGAPIAIIEKKRPEPGVAKVMNLIGDVKGKNCIIVDDIVDTAGSLVEGAKALKEFGAKSVMAAVTHAVLTAPASERIANSNIKELIVTNTMPLPENCKLDNVTQLSVAPLLGEAIMRIFHEVSVSNLFDK